MNLGQLMTAMSPPSVPDDTVQCGAFPCKLPAEGACQGCGEPLCPSHAHKCDTCGEMHCRKCVTTVDDLTICNKDFPEFVNDLVPVVAHVLEQAERRKRLRVS